MRSAVVLACTAALVVCVPPAGAESGRDVQTLAAAAADGDRGALGRLLAVTEVDGAAVDFRAAVNGAEGAELESRLRTLASGEAPPATLDDPSGAAAEILDDSRFQGSDVPRPFHGALVWLGERLRALLGPVLRVVDGIPGDTWVVPGLVVVVAAAVGAWLVARRRAGPVLGGNDPRHRVDGRDPGRLESEADEAERRGELELALRLRFQAGLSRLALADAIPKGEWTSGELRPVVAHPEFDRVATDLDAVVYGRRPARPEDVAASKRAWGAVVAGVRAR